MSKSTDKRVATQKAKKSSKKGKKVEQTPDTTVYRIGAKPYNPRAAHNQVSYARILPMLEKGATRAELIAKLSYTDKEWEKEKADGAPKLQQVHQDFISYLHGNGNIAPTG